MRQQRAHASTGVAAGRRPQTATLGRVGSAHVSHHGHGARPSSAHMRFSTPSLRVSASTSALHKEMNTRRAVQRNAGFDIPHDPEVRLQRAADMLARLDLPYAKGPHAPPPGTHALQCRPPPGCWRSLHVASTRSDGGGGWSTPYLPSLPPSPTHADAPPASRPAAALSPTEASASPAQSRRREEEAAVSDRDCGDDDGSAELRQAAAIAVGRPARGGAVSPGGHQTASPSDHASAACHVDGTDEPATDEGVGC